MGANCYKIKEAKHRISFTV